MMKLISRNLSHKYTVFKNDFIKGLPRSMRHYVIVQYGRCYHKECFSLKFFFMNVTKYVTYKVMG